MAKIDREALVALRERLVAAEGADSILDRRICIAFGIAPWTGAQALWEPEQVMRGSRTDRNTPAFTASVDAAIALLERDPDYKADPKRFLTECTIHARQKDFDYSRPAAPQAARHMLIGYLGAKIALLTSEPANAR